MVAAELQSTPPQIPETAAKKWLERHRAGRR